MKLDKLNLLEKIRKEQLEEAILELKKYQHKLSEYQLQINEYDNTKQAEFAAINQNILFGFSISNFLININQQIDNIQNLINECNHYIEQLELIVYEKFQELKQIEILIQNSKQQIKIQLEKIEQQIMDEIALRRI